MAPFTISAVRTEPDLHATKALIETYTRSLGIDLSYQDHAHEMASLPGKYAAPSGTLLLARGLAGEPIGCVGVRALPAPGPASEPEPESERGCCEMKRLYVDPNGRGLGVGKALALASIDAARRLGYRAIRLDTLASMTSAIALYERLGFRQIEAYYWSPVEGTKFMELKL